MNASSSVLWARTDHYNSRTAYENCSTSPSLGIFIPWPLVLAEYLLTAATLGPCREEEARRKRAAQIRREVEADRAKGCR